MAIVIAVVSILAGIALTNFDFERYRMDANARALQGRLLAQHRTAIQRNVPVLVAMDHEHGSVTITQDANANGIADSAEFTFSSNLDGRARFVRPPSTVDGAAPDFATGPGLTYLNRSYDVPTITFYPNGSSSGNVVVYIGSRRGRATDLRALRITGATSDVRIYRVTADGTWRLVDL